MTNLTQAITIHSAYGVEVEYRDGTILVIDPKQPYYNSTEKTISIWDAINDIEQGKAKLLLNSLDKLTQEIDGKVGIVELDKLFFGTNGEIFELYDGVNAFGWDERISEDDFQGFGICLDDGDFSMCYSEDISDDGITLKEGGHSLYSMPKNNKTKEWALANHYNVFGLSSEFVKSKSQ